jgi:hypothetical protein
VENSISAAKATEKLGNKIRVRVMSNITIRYIDTG